jgi:hypothetical protein
MRTESLDASKKTSRDDSRVETTTKTFKGKVEKNRTIMHGGESI